MARFLAKEVEPFAQAWEEQGCVPREVLRKMGSLGLLGITYPQEYGGAEADALTSLVFAEALSRSTFGGFVVTVLVHTDMASPHLVHAGTREQLRGICPGSSAASSSRRWASPSRTPARTWRGCAPGHGGRVASGCSTAPRCSSPTACTRMSTSSPRAPIRDAKGSRGISMFIVEKGTPGFRVGRALKKTGWLCSDTAELVFDDCRVPEANLLGEENRGFYAVMRNFQTERIALSAMAVGHCMTALALTLDYVRTRKAFGATLYDKQTIRQRLAMLQAKTEAARQFMYHCAWL